MCFGTARRNFGHKDALWKDEGLNIQGFKVCLYTQEVQGGCKASQVCCALKGDREGIGLTFEGWRDEDLGLQGMLMWSRDLRRVHSTMLKVERVRLHSLQFSHVLKRVKEVQGTMRKNEGVMMMLRWPTMHSIRRKELYKGEVQKEEGEWSLGVFYVILEGVGFTSEQWRSLDEDLRVCHALLTLMG